MVAESTDSREGRFPFGLPRGWFAVAWSDDLAAGEVKSLRYFSTELVLFRTEDGQARVLDAYCPHLGAHLGLGQVEKDTIVCPFHAWRWAGDGRCVAIPYAKKIPPRARMQSWAVLEHSGAIFVWYDPDGAEPRFDLPPHPELADTAWVPVERHEFHVATAVQEIGENGNDAAHFMAVHGVPALPDGTSEFAGAEAISENRGAFETPRGPVETSIRGHSYGLGVGYLRTRGIADMGQLLLQTPIDEEHVHVRWQFAVPRKEDGAPESVGVAFAREFVRQFNQDIPIWESKQFIDRPVLCDGDRNIGPYRQWAKQFYERA